MSAREWLILTGWVLVAGTLLWRIGRRIDREEEELERSHAAEMQNWPEG